MGVSQHIKEHLILGVRSDPETLLHTELLDMPDTAGTNTDHDLRYWTLATAQTGLTGDKSGSFDLTTTGDLTSRALTLNNGYLSFNTIANFGSYGLLFSRARASSADIQINDSLGHLEFDGQVPAGVVVYGALDFIATSVSPTYTGYLTLKDSSSSENIKLYTNGDISTSGTLGAGATTVSGLLTASANLMLTSNIYPAADSTTAIGISTFAAPTTQWVIFDTTNKKVGIGVTPSSVLDVADSSRAITTYQGLNVRSTSAFGVDIGPGISFTNKYNTAGDYVAGAGIIGKKENVTDGNYATYMAFYTRANGASQTEGFRLTSGQNLQLKDGMYIYPATDSTTAIMFSSLAAPTTAKMTYDSTNGFLGVGVQPHAAISAGIDSGKTPATTADLAFFETTGSDGITLLTSLANGTMTINFGHGTFNNLQYIKSTGTSWNMDYGAFNNHRWFVVGTQRMYLDSQGRLGLTTTTPTYKFEVKTTGSISAVAFTGVGLNDPPASGGTYVGTDNAAYTITVTISTSAATDKFTWRKGSGAESAEIAITGAAQTLTDGVTIDFVNTAGHTVGDYWTITVTPYNPVGIYNAAGTNVFTINNDGNVGVGTTAQTALLHVQSYNKTDVNNTLTGSGFAVSDNNNTFGLFVRNRGNSAGIGGYTYTTQILSGTAGNGLEIYTPNATDLVLGTGAKDRIHILGSGAGAGNVGIGTTAPAVKLHQDGGNATATYHKFTAGTTTGLLSTDGFDVGIDASGNAELRQRENLPLYFYTNNTLRATLEETGAFKTIGRKRAVTTKTTTYTMLTTDETIIGNSTTAFTVTLPAASGSGQIYAIKNINTGAVTVEGDSSDTIDSGTNIILGQWDAVQLVDYASNKWIII